MLPCVWARVVMPGVLSPEPNWTDNGLSSSWYRVYDAAICFCLIGGIPVCFWVLSPSKLYYSCQIPNLHSVICRPLEPCTTKASAYQAPCACLINMMLINLFLSYKAHHFQSWVMLRFVPWLWTWYPWWEMWVVPAGSTCYLVGEKLLLHLVAQSRAIRESPGGGCGQVFGFTSVMGILLDVLILVSRLPAFLYQCSDSIHLLWLSMQTFPSLTLNSSSLTSTHSSPFYLPFQYRFLTGLLCTHQECPMVLIVSHYPYAGYQ